MNIKDLDNKNKLKISFKEAINESLEKGKVKFERIDEGTVKELITYSFLPKIKGNRNLKRLFVEDMVKLKKINLVELYEETVKK